MAETDSSYLILRLAEQLLALPVSQTVEVCRVPSLRPARGEAPGLMGMAVLRGTLTAVLDLRVLLGWAAGETEERESAPITDQRRLVTVRMSSPDRPEVAVALVVDEVIGLRAIPAERMSMVALPGDRSQRVGAFDESFARLLDSSGLVDPEVWQGITEAAKIGTAVTE